MTGKRVNVTKLMAEWGWTLEGSLYVRFSASTSNGVITRYWLNAVSIDANSPSILHREVFWDLAYRNLPKPEIEKLAAIYQSSK